MIRFKLLGTLEVTNETCSFTPTAPRVLSTLALLLVRSNHLVSVETIIEELWGEDHPRSAATTAQTYIYQIRRWLDDELPAAEGSELLITRPPGYALRVDPGQIDVSDFERLLAEGRALLAADRPEPAAARLREALDLWTGPPLANVQLGCVLEGHSVALEEQRNRALSLRIEADLRMGRHWELIGELRSLVAMRPYDEWYHSLLVYALAYVGRRYDALEAYHAARRILADELGLSPAPELCRIRDAVLNGSAAPPPLSCAPAEGLRRAS